LTVGLVLALAYATLLPTTGTAAEALTVRLRTGRSLEAQRVETVGAEVRVTLASGGSVVLPAAVVAAVRPAPGAGGVAAARDHDPDAPPVGACSLVERPSVSRWDDLISTAASRHGLDPRLVRAVVAAESGGDPAAVSRKGAVGLMQLMPATAAEHGCSDPRDPGANVEAGCRHLARLVGRWPGRLELALAAYNAGESVVERAGAVPGYGETKRYVAAVMGCLGS
jgi:soluble lytic murein transglycosylase-like protein